jgi:ketosteroid isomerase-like protein
MFRFHLVILFSFIVHITLAQKNLETSILDIEKKRFEAMVNKDIQKLKEVIGDDLVYIHSNGNVDTKESFINAIEEGRSSYDNITIDEAEVRTYGNTAIINGICTYYRKNQDGNPNNLQLRYTNVYVKQKGKWQMVSWQSYRMS